MCDVSVETLFSVSFHSCKKKLSQKFLKNNMSSPEYEGNVYKSWKTFFAENTDSDVDKLNDLIGDLLPYCYDPEKDAIESSGNNSVTSKD